MSSAALAGLYAVTRDRRTPTWLTMYCSMVSLSIGTSAVVLLASQPRMLEPLAARFRVYTPERRAHGRTPDVAGPITFDAMATDTIAFLEAVVGRRAHVVGCSDGGIVGLLVALRRPDLIDRLVLVAGVFHFQGWLPQVIDPNNRPPGFLAPLYEEVSQMAPVTSGSRGQAGKDVQRRTDDQSWDLGELRRRPS